MTRHHLLARKITTRKAEKELYEGGHDYLTHQQLADALMGWFEGHLPVGERPHYEIGVLAEELDSLGHTFQADEIHTDDILRAAKILEPKGVRTDGTSIWWGKEKPMTARNRHAGTSAATNAKQALKQISNWLDKLDKDKFLRIEKQFWVHARELYSLVGMAASPVPDPSDEPNVDDEAPEPNEMPGIELQTGGDRRSNLARRATQLCRQVRKIRIDEKRRKRSYNTY